MRKVKGVWKYLHRAVDKAGATVDFLLTAKRDCKAALRFLRKAIRCNGHTYKVITIDKIKRWSTKFGQVDKWKLCLKVARMPRIRSDDGKTNTPDPCPGLQGKGGAGRD